MQRIIHALRAASVALLAFPALVHSASLTSSGYTNSFSAQPLASDWTTAIIAGGAGDVATGPDLDAAVQAIGASAITGTLTPDSGTPPAASGAGALWSSGGGYIQTRPTGIKTTLLMCTLVNNLGTAASSISIGYDFAKNSPVTEEIDGHHVYYSLTGDPGSWVVIPGLSAVPAGRASATATFTWPFGSTLYLVWADDNGSGSPDTSMEIDNFSITATPASQVPATITAQPASLTVPELKPFSFTVAALGFPFPALQWYRGGVAIPGATNSTYSNAIAVVGDNGAVFTVTASNVASNVTYVVTSSNAVLTVIADTNRPTVSSVSGSGGALVQVTYSEPVLASTATNLANYAITNAAGATLQITNLVLAPDGTNVILSTLPQTLGSTYYLRINNVKDISAAGNVIAANTLVSFVAVAIGASDIGAPGLPGSVTAVGGNGYNVTGAGTGLGGLGAGDQFTFGNQPKAGDFDVKVRVADFTGVDPFSEATLMARETTQAGSMFASVVAAPPITGCFFESRSTNNATSVRSGSFAANYPNAWLRLRRVGNVFTGFAGIDGQNWVQLGSATVNIGTVLLGFAVTSHDATHTASAQFRDYSDVTTAQVIPSVTFASEVLSAAARTGPMVISEIMYKPGGTNTNSLEFVELYNSNPYYEDISGYRLAGDIDFTFPSNTIVQGGAFIVVARNPAALMAADGITGVMGPYAGSLGSSGSIRLRSDIDSVLLDVDYSNESPWPIGADGTGHSLVLTRASYGQNDPQAWDVSDRVGGSPGRHEPLRVKAGLRNVVINEFLAQSVLPDVDYIELYNHSTQPVDISGCYLSDSPSTNKFKIAPGTILGPRSFISFTETQLGFGLSHNGEQIFFRSADAQQMIDAIGFGAQEAGVAFGRFPDGSDQFYRLRSQTPGTNNTAFLSDDIVINEIMYSPISEDPGDEFVELYNKGTNTINLGGWQFTSGISFRFPDNVSIAPDAYVVVAKNAANLISHYGNLNAGNTFGNFSGSLSGRDRVAIGKPGLDISTNGSGQLRTNIIYFTVDEVTYANGGRWGQWANGGGSSLELVDPRSNHRLAQNWADSDETAKAPWTLFEHTGILDNGSTQGGTSIDRLEVTMLGEGECLLDDVEVHSPTNSANLIANPSFELGLSPWVPQGNHIISSIENVGRSGSRSLHVRADGNGDTGANRIRVTISPALAANQFCTIRAYARWLHGWPEIALRIKGDYLENVGHLTIPANLGSPGARNSRALANAGPAISAVVHSPVLPQASEPVVVTARAHDADGIEGISLMWRVDSASPPAYTALPMNDSGILGDAVAGDGVYSATIPAQAAGTMVTFFVEATDIFNATNQFPVNPVPQRECLVRWGDPTPPGAFAVYRMWLSTANVNAYINRPPLSNLDIDGTMIVANSRPIYNMKSHYSNSPYHQNTGVNGSPAQNSNPVTAPSHIAMRLPEDDMYLGATSFNKIHAPGNAAFEDSNWIREQTAYWLVKKSGLPYLYRRFVAMYVNGTRHAGGYSGRDALMEDTQRPGQDLIDEFFPNETSGRLFKIQPWFEFDDVTSVGGGSSGFDNKLWAVLVPNLSTNAHKTARYRQNFLSRSANKTANDYTNIVELINAANVPPSNPAYWQNMNGLIDVDEWAGIFACEHAVGNWDSFGNRNAQNMYGYKPDGGKWKLMIWDLNIVLNTSQPGTTSDMPSPTTAANPAGPGSVGNLFQFQASQDPTAMANLNNYPAFRRAWWRNYRRLTVGPSALMLAANVEPLIDAKYAAFRASGLTPGADPTSVKTFLATARANIAGAVQAADAGAFVVSNTTLTATASNVVIVGGIAPFDVTTIEINGQSWPLTWNSITNWTVAIPATNSTSLKIAAYDRNHNLIGSTNTVTVNYAAATPPDPRGFVLFNEIMYTPAPENANAEYIELYNSHTNFTFDLSGWQINGLSYTFPVGSYFPPRSYIVLVRDRVAFGIAYGPNVPVFGEYGGTLQSDGETISLIKPGATSAQDLVVDRVRYEGGLPWPLIAHATGSSVQLIDSQQDNARTLNWTARYVPPVVNPAIATPETTNDGWRFVSLTATFGGNNRFLIYLDNGGSVMIDDIAIVAGTNAGVGQNFVKNGGFESPLGSEWTFGTNMSASSIVTGNAHSGTGALLLTQSIAGSASVIARDLLQTLSPAPTNQQVSTLSFWYFATNNSATNLSMRVVSSALTLTTNIGVFIVPSNYVPPQVVVPGTNYATPGAANTVLASLPSFQTLWINELEADNLTGIRDSYGERDPWIELYNPGTNSVSLDGLYLSTNYSNLTAWAFPAGMSIGAGQFKIIWCDGQSIQTSNTELHTSFRLPSVKGSIALSRVVSGEPQVLDYVNYSNLHVDRSYGSYPDGQPFDRLEFYFLTPGGTNDPRSAPITVFINEWMPANTNTVNDPADGKFSDWFEVYNPSTNLVDLAGYYFTDTLTNKVKFRVTTSGTHTINPGGHLLVWADSDENQNTSNYLDLHVSFKLSKSGGAIGLFAADGTQIDAVTYATGMVNIAEGRYPDGSANIIFLTNATPRAANFVAGSSNASPVLSHIGNRSIYLGQTLQITATASDSDVPAQALSFSLDPGFPAGASITSGGNFSFTPSGSGSYAITIRVTDNGTPSMSASETIIVDVYSDPQFDRFVRNGNNLELRWDTHAGKTYRVEYKDDLNAPDWTLLQDIPATGSTLSITNSAISGQRFYRITVQ